MTIELKLEDKVIELNTHEVEGKTLYKAQDLLKGYGMTNEQYNDTIRNWKTYMEKKVTVKFTVTLKKGSNDKRGTYLNKRNLLKLAAYVDKTGAFEDAVYEAFELLTEAKPMEAMKVANSVAISQELIDKANFWFNELKHQIPKCSTFYKLGHAYPKIIDLACKVSTGYTVKQLTGGRNISALNYIIKKNHPECLGAYACTMEMIARQLKAGVEDYHVIAASLGVSTSKNGELIIN